uniref:Uncharacterized protein n=2 Tax=Cuerna arida TaxID=1464854 RepID=A0A1B6GC99_9HEMI
MKLNKNVNFNIDLYGLNNIMTSYCFLFIILTILDVGVLDNITTLPPTFSNTQTEERKPFLKPEEKYERFEILYSLKDVWDVINSPQYSSVPVVKKIRAMWEDKTVPRIVQKKPRKRRKNATTTIEPPETSWEDELVETTPLYETTTRMRLPGRQNPFVLVEGTLTLTRRKLLRGLMKHTTFAYVRTMRKSPFKYKDKFKGPELLKLKRAFVSLQLYLTGRDVETILEERPVIMSGFWMRQAAEYIARRYQDLSQLPGIGSACYQWPADLVTPDLILFLHTPRANGTVNEDTVKRHQR